MLGGVALCEEFSAQTASAEIEHAPSKAMSPAIPTIGRTDLTVDEW
jgi:hypothetical protein